MGPVAHGRVTVVGGRLATSRHRAPELRAERVERDGHGSVRETLVAPEERARGMLLIGLRLTEGIDAAAFAARTGPALEDAVDAEMLVRAQEAQYLVRRDGRLAATAEGRLRLDALLAALVV